MPRKSLQKHIQKKRQCQQQCRNQNEQGNKRKATGLMHQFSKVQNRNLCASQFESTEPGGGTYFSMSPRPKLSDQIFHSSTLTRRPNWHRMQYCRHLQAVCLKNILTASLAKLSPFSLTRNPNRTSLIKRSVNCSLAPRHKLPYSAQSDHVSPESLQQARGCSSGARFGLRSFGN